MIKRPEILIVDDNAADLRALHLKLAELDADILHANSGNTALSYTIRHDFALILLDVHMPEMSGFEVASILHGNAKTTNIPIIFITAAYKEELYQVQGYEAGAIDYIEKPINLDILIPKVLFFMKLHANQKRLEQAIASEQKANEALQNQNVLRKKLERKLVEAVREAQVATESKAEFLAKMSHEIRTPMHGVLGMAELLEKSPLNDAQHNQVKIILNSGTLLLTIINDILDFSKLESGLVSLESIPFNLEHTIHDVMTLLAASIQYDHLELVLDYPVDMVRHFMGDPARIRQILNNLLGNAIKFTERGIILVKVRAQHLENDLVQIDLKVQDSGIGIRQDKIDSLFSSFTQADNSTTREYGGTGLGLSICKQLVEVMGGKISVESVLGEGSTFGVELALIESDSPAVIIQKDLHGCKILLVVDNSVTRELYQKILTPLGIEITIIDHPEAIIRTLKGALSTKLTFDIVIFDDNLTDKAGLDVGKQIRANEAFDETKLMILTSFASRGDAQVFADAGFDAYLTKPLLAENLTDSLVGLLQSTRNNKQLITQHSIAESKLQLPEHFDAHILLVEDIMINQLVAKQMLEDLGLTLDIVDNGLQAVERFKQHQLLPQNSQQKPYDLIFMDCLMPVMDGYEATRAIRELESAEFDKTSHIPIVALTANALADDKAKCTESGMDDFVTKPFGVADLERVLHLWLATDK